MPDPEERDTFFDLLEQKVGTNRQASNMDFLSSLHKKPPGQKFMSKEIRT